ncbi:unnamed protein product [Brassicogethes aeneus]|uniref:DUF4200 domain-containing protein n=1 Tax=Brassicogethes aeneus TaxID=1431903 RepID=A0A9P0AVE8_BRAAE|nr:unnamed protein product [Brassicogethes aeneus]
MSEGSGVTRLTVTDESVLRNEQVQRPKFHLVKKKLIPPKPKTKIIKRYFTSAAHVNEENQRNFKKEPSPFSYPNDLEMFAHKVMTKAWRAEVIKNELNKKAIERTNYTSRQNEDLLNRLYVKEPVVTNMKTIVDVDPEYFKAVEGRPYKEKFNYLRYKNVMRDLLKMKIMIGYREDDIMLIEDNIKTEKKIIEDLKERYQEYVNVFEEFLFRDHTASMNLLHEADLVSKLCNQKYEEFKAMAKEYSGLRSVLYGLEEKWRNCQMYQKFLYLISPISWRRENDPNLNKDKEFITVDAVKEIYNKYNTTEDKTLDELMDGFMKEYETLEAPKLYFTDPYQLMEIFLFMEMQNLNSLLHSEELAEPIEVVKASMEKARIEFDSEIQTLEESIDKLEGGILWEEERAKYLEELAHELINGPFKDLLINESLLDLHVYVEDVYETRIAQNDANLSMGEMIQAIVNRYRDELLQLDKLPVEQVAKLEGNAYMEQIKILKLAEDAKKQYQSLERLTLSIEKAFEPPFRKTGRQIKNRSPPLNPPKPLPPPPRVLTEAETDFLTFFTDYCEFSDDVRNYGINPEQVLEEVAEQVNN